jgi:NAD(P)-dependent dehydrogenase (short-subunit alcohol dehydrogenase family)
LAKYPSAVIYATARSPATAVGLQKLHKDHPDRIHILEVDVADASSIHLLKETVSQTTSTLDQVIYSAGVLKGLGPLTAAGLDGLKENMTVNLFGAYASAMEFFPFVERSTYPKKVLTFIGSSFGSITTFKENFEMHNLIFGTTGVNMTAAYDISKVCTILACG